MNKVNNYKYGLNCSKKITSFFIELSNFTKVLGTHFVKRWIWQCKFHKCYMIYKNIGDAFDKYLGKKFYKNIHNKFWNIQNIFPFIYIQLNSFVFLSWICFLSVINFTTTLYLFIIHYLWLRLRFKTYLIPETFQSQDRIFSSYQMTFLF